MVQHTHFPSGFVPIIKSKLFNSHAPYTDQDVSFNKKLLKEMLDWLCAFMMPSGNYVLGYVRVMNRC